MFLFLSNTKLIFLCNVDVGRVQPEVEPEREEDVLAERAIGREVLQDPYLSKTLTKLQQHIEGLTFGIPDYRIEEIPM